ncbi:MAG: S8 family peptidase [Chitinivibrionia bacterium]|nr:S8 family peptidase [Chitinivibrionia bacterium]
MRTMQSLFVCMMTLIVFTFPAEAGNDKLNSTLRFLRSARAEARKRPLEDPRLSSAVEAASATVTVKFDHVLSGAEISSYEERGIRFYRIDGETARSETVYPMRIPWSMIDELSGRVDVRRVESAWRPAVYPTLDVSAHEIEADSVWVRNDPLGNPLTGKGLRIADFDTGIDVFHPSFFYADGDTFDWLDINLDNTFTPGADCVDLNRNGLLDTGERLRFTDGWIYDPAHVWGYSTKNNQDYIYQTWWDWLYADTNNNGFRSAGPGAGFTENDPTFGEPMFIALDENADGALDVGEKLVALGTSKIFATMNADSVERVRGTDLILTQNDTNGHGTAVSGILAGGTPGRHRFCGIAPDAEILAGACFSDFPISYLIPWARTRGADVMLYEFGGFVYDFLDGSSLDEELITSESANIVQVTPSGNLGRGAKHAVAVVPPADSLTLEITVPMYGSPILYFYGTTLWRTNLSDLTLRLKSPLGGEVTLDGTVWDVNNYGLWYDFATSSRGTHKFDLYVDRGSNANALGLWKLKVINNGAEPAEIISNVADHLSSWAGGAEFLNYVSDDKNVTWPATSDHAFVNGSYSTRGFEGYSGVGSGSISVGEISAFSGRGVRVDGWHLLDICSPGNYDVYSTRSHTDPDAYQTGSYRQFSGTSAAGPHVAAAAALVLQSSSEFTAQDAVSRLTSSAAADAFTGEVYNDTWGYGKLRILNAVNLATGIEEIAAGTRAPALLLDRNYPNPFNPTTWIPFFLPEEGRASVAIYDVTGAVVKVIRDRWYEKGAHSVTWDGTDAEGRSVASGVYLCVLSQGREKQTRKLVLIR